MKKEGDKYVKEEEEGDKGGKESGEKKDDVAKEFAKEEPKDDDNERGRSRERRRREESRGRKRRGDQSEAPSAVRLKEIAKTGESSTNPKRKDFQSESSEVGMLEDFSGHV